MKHAILLNSLKIDRDVVIASNVTCLLVGLVKDAVINRRQMRQLFNHVTLLGEVLY